MIVRDQAGHEVAEVQRVLTDAFADTGRVAGLVAALLAGPARACLVADDDGLVGSVVLSRAWVDAPDRLVDVLVLSPLGVVTARQAQGIGGVLVRAAIGRADELGAPLLFLEGSPRYYPRHGFRPAGELGFGRPSVRIPQPAFQVVPLASYDPAVTGALVYPEAFWAHDCVGLRRAASGE